MDTSYQNSRSRRSRKTGSPGLGARRNRRCRSSRCADRQARGQERGPRDLSEEAAACADMTGFDQPQLDKPKRKTVAVITVHGVGDQAPFDTVRRIGDLLQDLDIGAPPPDQPPPPPCRNLNPPIPHISRFASKRSASMSGLSSFRLAM